MRELIVIVISRFLQCPQKRSRGNQFTRAWGQPFMTSTLRGRGQAQAVDACGRGGGPAPSGRPHRKLKLESTDVIYCLLLMQRSWRLFYQNFVFGQKKVEIFLRYKFVI